MQDRSSEPRGAGHLLARTGNFTDNGGVMEAFKTLPYKESGPTAYRTLPESVLVTWF